MALLAGDLTGKAIVPIVQNSDGRYETDLFGVHRTARGDEELAALQRDIADVGYYSFVTTAQEAERLSGDEPARDELLHRLMNERVGEWLELATERLADSQVPLYLIPGNDDEFGIDEILDAPGHSPVNADGQVVDMPGGLAAPGLRLVQPHPVADPPRGVRGRALRPPGRAGQAGLRPPPRRVHDPRPAPRLGPGHRPDPRREPPAHDLGRRRPARAGGLHRGAAHHRGLPARRGHPRPHPRVRGRAQDRQHALHQPRAPRPTTGSCGGTWWTSARRASSSPSAWRGSRRRRGVLSASMGSRTSTARDGGSRRPQALPRSASPSRQLTNAPIPCSQPSAATIGDATGDAR